MSDKQYRAVMVKVPPYGVLAAIQELYRIAREAGATVFAAPNCAIFMTFEGPNLVDTDLTQALTIKAMEDAHMEVMMDEALSLKEIELNWPNFWAEY